nr:ribonuclease H-like domain, reverse transcriptase, RNA-dependent DNA polymerase [Tanacetum cinerariifolium]
DSPFDLEDFLDSDYAGASLDMKSTTGGCQFLGKRLISWQFKINIVKKQMAWIMFSWFWTNTCRFNKEKPTKSKGFEKIIDFLNASYVKYALMVNPTVYTSCIEQFWASAKVKNVNGEAHIQALVDKKKVIITEASIRRELRFKDERGVDCLSNEVILEQLTFMGHNAIFVVSYHTKKVFANMKREGKDFSGKVTPLFATMMVQAPEDMGEGSEIPTDTHHTPIDTQPSPSLP